MGRLDSEDETLRIDSETALKQELTSASYLHARVCFGVTKLQQFQN